MNNKVNQLLLIAGLVFSLTGIIFLCVAIFADKYSKWFLCIALGCTLVSNLFNITRKRRRKTDSTAS